MTWDRWFADFDEPLLPDGYQWECLRPAYGKKMVNGEHPWWVRVSWTMRNGKNRILKMTEEFFDTPQAAVEYAIREAIKHSEKQRIKQCLTQLA